MLNRVSIKQKLFIFIFIPLVMMLMFFAHAIRDKHHAIEQGAVNVELIAANQLIKHFISELRLERSLLLNYLEIKEGKTEAFKSFEATHQHNKRHHREIVDIFEQYNHNSAQVSPDMQINLAYIKSYDVIKDRLYLSKDRDVNQKVVEDYHHIIVNLLNNLNNMPHISAIRVDARLIAKIVELEEGIYQFEYLQKKLEHSELLTHRNLLDYEQLLNQLAQTIDQIKLLLSGEQQTDANPASNSLPYDWIEKIYQQIINAQNRWSLFLELQQITDSEGMTNDLKKFLNSQEPLYATRFIRKINYLLGQLNQLDVLSLENEVNNLPLVEIKQILRNYLTHLLVEPGKLEKNTMLTGYSQLIKSNDIKLEAFWEQLKLSLLKHDVTIQNSLSLNTLNDFRFSLEQHLNNEIEQINEKNQFELKLLYLIMLSSIMLTLFLGWKIVLRVGTQLQNLTERVIAFSQPDAHHSLIEVSGEDEISALKKAFNQMVQDRKDYEQGMWQQANFDYLTELPNRQLLSVKLEDAILRANRANEKLYLLFLDLDNFKMVNDTWGHKTGDELLIKVSERLRMCIRTTDIIARLGGDEFVICLTGTLNEIKVEQICETIIEAIHQPYFFDETTESIISTSIGVSIYPDDSQSVEDLMKKADTAMYQAKNHGKQTFRFYQQSMSDNIEQYMSLSKELRNALGTQQFELYYQPVVNLNLNRIVGAEALLRWKHPKKGILSPAEFLETAEQSGLMGEIGNWVINQASNQLKYWESIGFSLHITVNISASQCDDGSLLKILKNSLKNSTFGKDKLHIEITESQFLEDTVDKVLMLQSIRDLGIDIYLDDFGTGYSSLSYLKKLPINVLKIDRSFVKDMLNNQDDGQLVRAIISMAKGLNLKLVAEGIEDQEQLELLKDLACDYGQGYYFSKPIPANEFETLLFDQQSDHSSSVKTEHLRL